MNPALVLAPICLMVVVLVMLTRRSFLRPELARQFLRDGARVVDVRNPGEFNSAHLPAAVNLPLPDLTNQIPRLFPDKNAVLLLHCQSGARSAIAVRQLKKLGYTRVFNLGSYSRAGSLIGENRDNS